MKAFNNGLFISKMTVEIVAILMIFPLILVGNLLLFRLFIKSAIKRFVIPFLGNKGYLLVDYKWVGFFDCGDFKNEQMDFALFKTGPKSISIFSYIYYKDLDNTKRATIKINVESLSVVNVIYSSEI